MTKSCTFWIQPSFYYGSYYLIRPSDTPAITEWSYMRGGGGGGGGG